MTGNALANHLRTCNPSPVRPQILTINDIAREALISKSTAERCFKKGWLPKADRTVRRAAGGTEQREWHRSTVTVFIRECRRAKESDLALSEVFGKNENST